MGLPLAFAPLLYAPAAAGVHRPWRSMPAGRGDGALADETAAGFVSHGYASFACPRSGRRASAMAWRSQQSRLWP